MKLRCAHPNCTRTPSYYRLKASSHIPGVAYMAAFFCHAHASRVDSHFRVLMKQLRTTYMEAASVNDSKPAT